MVSAEDVAEWRRRLRDAGSQGHRPPARPRRRLGRKGLARRRPQGLARLHLHAHLTSLRRGVRRAVRFRGPAARFEFARFPDAGPAHPSASRRPPTPRSSSTMPSIASDLHCRWTAPAATRPRRAASIQSRACASSACGRRRALRSRYRTPLRSSHAIAHSRPTSSNGRRFFLWAGF